MRLLELLVPVCEGFEETVLVYGFVEGLFSGHYLLFEGTAFVKR